MSVTGGVSNTSRIAKAVMLVVAGLVALFNGWEWSPLYDSVAQILYQATRGYPLATAQRMSDVTPVAIAIVTLLIAGIPAAIYERIRGLPTSTTASVGIWLLATLLLTLPTLMIVFGDE